MDMRLPLRNCRASTPVHVLNGLAEEVSLVFELASNFTTTSVGAECAERVAALQTWIEDHVKKMVRCQLDYDG